MRKLTFLAGVTAALVSFPAFAQDASQDTALEGDYLSVAVGAVYMPSYRGSDDYVVSPVPLVRGRFKGVEINPRGGGAALDFIPDAQDAKIGFQLGPVATYSGNRARQIKDDVVKRVGKLDDAVEVGVNAGFSAYRLLNAYDQLTVSADVRWDVASSYKGMVWVPSVTYATPVSKAAVVTLNVNAHHGDGKFSRYYYSVTPQQSLDTDGALPVYGAKKGWDSINVGMMAAYDLDGNLLNGGLSVFAGGLYGKMLNDGKDTPYTRLRGDSDQWIGAVGVGLTF